MGRAGVFGAVWVGVFGRFGAILVLRAEIGVCQRIGTVVIGFNVDIDGCYVLGGLALS